MSSGWRRGKGAAVPRVELLEARNLLSFLPAVNYAAGTGAVSVAVGDFNGDGVPDLAVSDVLNTKVAVLLGNGDGTFQPAVTYAVGNDPRTVAVADVNGDGIPDLVV